MKILELRLRLRLSITKPKFTMKGSRFSIIKQKIIPLASHIVLTVISLYCLLLYYTNITESNLTDLGYVTYLTMLLNGLVSLTKIVNEESFIDLGILADYGQIVLCHPFITTAFWQKYSEGRPNETALVHCIFGLAAFLFFAIMEYKRQDLTDLALIISVPSSIIVGAIEENYFACGAGVLMAAAYFGLKRGEECMLQPSAALSAYFNFCMAAYSLVTIAQFEPRSWVPEF